MTNSGRGDQAGVPRSHRRVDPDELTLDDLFRPEPQAQQHRQQPPAAQPYPQPGPQQPPLSPAPPPVQPAGYQGQQHWAAPGEPWQAQPGGAPGGFHGQAQAPGPQPGGPAAPEQGRPWGAQAAPQGTGGAADETRVLGAYSAVQEPTAQQQADGDETRPIPRVAQDPPRPAGPEASPLAAPPPHPGTRSPSTQGSASPFTIRPGLPGRPSDPSYDEESAQPGPDDADGAATRPLPPVRDGEPGSAPAPQPPAGYGGHRPSAPAQGAPGPYPRPAAPSSTPGATAPPRSRRAAPARSGRRLSPAALGAIVVAGCAVAGLAAGAALSGGGEEERSGEPQKAAATASSSSAPATEEPSEKPEDPALTQAKSLDALLQESNDSRSAVIRAVEEIRHCKNLDGAARSLRDAAGQRNNLVSRLAELQMDKLDNHIRLKAALNKAWTASASADNHYADWADDVAGKKGCKKGRARITGNAKRGNRASGEATEAKREAAQLWNVLARKYGLTERSATDL